MRGIPKFSGEIPLLQFWPQMLKILACSVGGEIKQRHE